MISLYIAIILMFLSALALVLLPYPSVCNHNRLAVVAGGIMVVGTLVSYYFLGASKDLAAYYHQQEIAQFLSRYHSPQAIIDQLQAHIANSPDKAKGWYLIGRLYKGTGQDAKAEQAFTKARELGWNFAKAEQSNTNQ